MPISWITTSLWIDKQERGIHLGRKSHADLTLLLLLCIKCLTCSKSIRKSECQEKWFQCGNVFHWKCPVDKIEYGHEKIFCRSCTVKVPLEGEPITPHNEYIYQYLADFLKPEGLKIFPQNINGLSNKFENVNIPLTETKRTIDILGITETHLQENIKDEEVELKG